MSAKIEELLEHTAWIRGLARRLVGDAGRAEDLVQETWLAALRRPPDAGRPARPWLARVVANLAHNEGRAGRRRERRESLGARPERHAPAAADVVARADAQRALVAEVLGLDEPYRSTLLSRYFDELTPAEIARREGVPAATVRSRVHRGLAQLRERLDARPGGRARWQPALLAVAKAPLGTAAKGTALATAGGWTMSASTVTKGALAAGLLVMAWFLGTELSRRQAAPVPNGPDGAVQPTETAVVAGDALRAAAASEGRAAARGPAAGVVETLEERAPDAAPEPAVARARCLDENGLPLAGVRLWTLHDEELERAVSGADGRVELRIRPGESWRRSRTPRAEPPRTLVPYRFSAPHVVTHQIDALARAGAVTELGDVRLRRAGHLAGRVVDEHGLALEGALVQFLPTDDEAPAAHGRAVGSEERFEGYEPVHSASDGSFELGGVPPGYARVLVSRVGYLAYTSATLAVAAGELVDCGELALRAVPDGRAIRGFALDPEGEPLAGVRVAWETESAGAGEVASDSTGRFLVAFEREPGGRVALSASDPEQRFAPSPGREVFAGGPPVALRLAPGRFLELHVRSGGAPLEAFEWAFVAAADGRALARGSDHYPGGVVRALVPAVPFRARVELHGFESVESAAFEPESAPEVLPIELVRRPGVSGRVTAAGEPVAGARVRALLPLDDTVAVTDGFWNVVSPHSGSTAVTDADGRFDAVPPGSRAYLRVRAPGFATALVGPLEIDMERGLGGLEVELGRGGALAGRVLAPPELALESLVVGVCRGDGLVLTTRPDARGEYRFEHLAPGPWQVGLCAADRNPDLSIPSYRVTERPGELPHQVEVAAGATARFDLVRERACRLVGRLTVGGAAPGPFEVELRPAGSERVLRGRATDSEGGFEVASPEPGPHVLVLRLGAGPRSGEELERTLALWRGENEWREDLE